MVFVLTTKCFTIGITIPVMD